MLGGQADAQNRLAQRHRGVAGREDQNAFLPQLRGQKLAPLFIADLKATLGDLGQQYALGDDLGALQDYCPACKRILRGQAYYQYLGKRFL